MPRIEGAIFDLDGTLLDSMDIWDGFGERYLTLCGIKARPDLEKIIHKLSIWEAAAYFREEYQVPKSEEKIVQEINQMIEKAYLYTIKAKKGASEFLHRLANQKVKMCIATATDRYQVEAALKREGLRSLFEEIYTCSEVGEGKQSPKIYLQAWQNLQTPKEHTWVFEDMLYATKTASSAGFPVIVVQDEKSLADEEQLRKIAVKYVTDYSELNDFFTFVK